MADNVPAYKRSEIMSKVRGSGNKSTELRLITLMRGCGIKGWRRKQKLPGSPDFVFRRYRVAVFVDGCFWHGCPKHGRLPKSNRTFWIDKLTRNKMRDRRIGRELHTRSWRVVRIWEHELKTPEVAIRKIQRALVAGPVSQRLRQILKRASK